LNGGMEIATFGRKFETFGASQIAEYIDPLVPRRLLPQGLLAFRTDTTNEISNFIRHVLPQGINSLAMGVGRIHPPEPVIPTGYVASLFGATWVSNYIRTLEVQGFDSFTTGVGSDFFAERMRVSERHTASVYGIASTLTFGLPKIASRVRYVVPTDEIVGAVSQPKVSARGYVALGGYGFDAGMFGDVQRWEAGKIKPYGDDMALHGTARIARTLSPISIGGTVGAPRIGMPIRPSGAAWFESGGAVVSHGDGTEYTCGQLPRAIAVPPSQFISFGTPTVQ
ncbi:MAG: hypothetical protein ACRDAM_08100, partial [Casimicrobium sp.]